MDSMSIRELLLKEASKSYIAHKISCAIIYRNEVIAVGYNHSNIHSSMKHQCLLRG